MAVYIAIAYYSGPLAMCLVVNDSVVASPHQRKGAAAVAQSMEVAMAPHLRRPTAPCYENCHGSTACAGSLTPSAAEVALPRTPLSGAGAAYATVEPETAHGVR